MKSLTSKQGDGIYLFNAPFSSPGNPYASVPTLMAYLKSKNIPAQACDLAQEFWHRFLTSEQIRSGINYVEERFLELNQKKKLSFYEVAEYKKVVSLLDAINKKRKIVDQALLPTSISTSFLYQDSRISALLIALATAPFFPSHMIIEPVTLLFSGFDNFSSKDIIASTKTDFFYCKLLREIIAEKLSSASPPRLVGISVTFETQVVPGFFCARLIKELLPTTHVVMGGAFVSLHLRELDDALLFKCVDSFVVDDGELPLAALYQELGQDNPDLAKVPALIRCQGSQVVKNPSVPPLLLATLAPPDYTVYNLGQYLSPLTDMVLSFRLSRGCYWQRCTFCRTELSLCKDYEQPPVEKVFADLCQIIEETGVRRISFSDESARPEILEFVARNLLERNIKIEWLAHTRFHPSLTAELFALLKESGCISLTLGLESYNDRILALMKKGINVELIDQVLTANTACLPLHLYMIVGFPTETETEARQCYARIMEFCAQKLIKNFNYSLFQLIYGSDIFKNPSAYGIEKIHYGANQDLTLDSHTFTGEGMSRKTATDLNHEFRAVAELTAKQEMMLMMYNEVNVRGQAVPLNYSFSQVKSSIMAQIHKLHLMPYSQWLESVDIGLEI
ncbi:MAG: radical SAM protein [Deltaproteobacteria bacterium]|nr:radical SAM protein [Deltaproteobacteria bacterium]